MAALLFLCLEKQVQAPIPSEAREPLAFALELAVVPPSFASQAVFTLYGEEPLCAWR